MALAADQWVVDLLVLAFQLCNQKAHSADVTWLSKLDLSCLLSAAQAHFAYWDPTIELKGSGATNHIYDAARYTHNFQTSIRMRTKNSLYNSLADTFAQRTSQPHYLDAKAGYASATPTSENVSQASKKVYSTVNRALHKFACSAGTINQSTVSNFKRIMRYIDVGNAHELLVETGLCPSTEAAAAEMRKVWRGWMNMVWDFPALRNNIGAELHSLPYHEAVVELLTAAVYGCFNGALGWIRFNKLLIQGSWGCISGYCKPYAKTVYAVIVSLYAAVQMGRVDKRGAGKVLLDLGDLFIGRSDKLPVLQVRQNNRLADRKVKAYSCAAYDDKDGTSITVPWSVSSKPENFSTDTPPFIVQGENCTHDTRRPWNGRFRVAHSLSELEQSLSSHESITVAQTLGDHDAQNEVRGFAQRHNIVTVQRSEGQCMRCAVKVAHQGCALIVVG